MSDAHDHHAKPTVCEVKGNHMDCKPPMPDHSKTVHVAPQPHPVPNHSGSHPVPNHK